MNPLRRPDWLLVGSFAALTILIHFLTNGGYGYFRDELYFMACGDHLAWGYVDLPPMVALVARFSRATMGDSLFAIRFFPALAGGATVAIAGILAWELGGGRFAQVLAMLAAMLAPAYLGVGNLLTMNAFDAIFWMGCVWALIRVIKTGDPRWWLMFGASAGLGLENKESMVFLGFGIVAGLALVPERKLMLNRWFVLGGIVALLLFMPTLVWQAMHHFPMYEELSNVKGSTKNTPITLLGSMGVQVLLMLPPSCVVWASGLYFFLLSARGRKFRAIGIAYLVIDVAFVILKGKAYYIAPFFPVLLGAGAVQLESIDGRGWRPAIRYALPAVIVIVGVMLAPMAIPVLPVETFIRYQRMLGGTNVRFETSKTGVLAQNYADMFGWPEMAATVAKVYDSLPPNERAQTAIFTSNYGEAAAIDFFGPRYGLPKAISGHMSYYLWGPGDRDIKVGIVIGAKEEDLKQTFGSVEQVAMVGTEYSMPFEHGPVYLCRDPKLPIQQLWPRAKVYR
ncbi:glycosyltransferase family 39 protein [Candidatus Binatus sp.]|uniref:glycosyltransferase family 39 protein n=1 Tax=Candidatus Binatus sp. TaxID=2811406 RepID=UPI002FDA7F07